MKKISLGLAGAVMTGLAVVASPEPAKAQYFGISFGFGTPAYGYGYGWDGWGYDPYYGDYYGGYYGGYYGSPYAVRRVVYDPYYGGTYYRRVVYRDYDPGLFGLGLFGSSGLFDGFWLSNKGPAPKALRAKAGKAPKLLRAKTGKGKTSYVSLKGKKAKRR